MASRAAPSVFAATAEATCRTGGARSRKACARARCARSSPPTPSSSASTSGRSTSASWPAIRARSRRPGSGRAGPGRRNRSSAAVMVASSAPLDQFIVRNPAYFFDASPERALINPDNLHILVDHIKCAAFELPFQRDRGIREARPAGGAVDSRRAGSRAPQCQRLGCFTGAEAALDRSGEAGQQRRHENWSTTTRSGRGPASRIQPTR